MRKGTAKLLHVLSLGAGFGLFGYLIYQTGLPVLGSYLKQLGWGFLFVVVLSAIRNCARAGSWYLAIDPEHRSIGFWQLIHVMLAGEAIKYLTATGPFLGEPAKAAMVRDRIPLLHGFSSVFAENLIYYLTVFVFMIIGLLAMIFLIELPASYTLAGYVTLGAIAVVGIAICLSVARRWFPLARTLEAAARIERYRGKLLPATKAVREVESSVYKFYRERRGAFFIILALNFAAHLINVVEVCAIFMFIGLPGYLSTGIVVEAVTKAVNLIFFFVPARAGVYESAHALTAAALGLPASAGVALGIIRKMRAFVWAGYGLLTLLVMGLGNNSRSRLFNPMSKT